MSVVKKISRKYVPISGTRIKVWKMSDQDEPNHKTMRKRVFGSKCDCSAGKLLVCNAWDRPFYHLCAVAITGPEEASILRLAEILSSVGFYGELWMLMSMLTAMFPF